MGYKETVLADNPFVYYRFSETTGTTASDEMDAHDGTYTGYERLPTLNQASALTTDTDPSISLNYDSSSGEGGCVLLTTLGDFGGSLGSTGITIECWLKLAWDEDCETEPRIFFIGDDYGVTKTASLQLSLYSTTPGIAWDRLNFLATPSSGASADAFSMFTTPSVVLCDNQWHHIVATFDGDQTGTVYIDGTSVAVTSSPEESYTWANWSTAGVICGYNSTEWGAEPEVPGYIDEFAIYPGVLTSAKALAHYTAGTTDPEPAFNLNLLRLPVIHENPL